MSNLAKLEFVAIDISDDNYLSWVLDAEIYLDVVNLGDSIKENNDASTQDHAQVMIFLRHHLREQLKSKYLMVKELYVLWVVLMKDLITKNLLYFQKLVMIGCTYDQFYIIQNCFSIKIMWSGDYWCRFDGKDIFYFSCFEFIPTATISRQEI